MVEAYWEIGKSIVEKQGGNATAEYGSRLLKELSKQMTADFGKGFTVTNLSYMRQFYLTFPIRHALRSELSWTHYRLIMRVEDEGARQFYMDECAKSNWSTRQLERQHWKKARSKKLICSVPPHPNLQGDRLNEAQYAFGGKYVVCSFCRP